MVWHPSQMAFYIYYIELECTQILNKNSLWLILLCWNTQTLHLSSFWGLKENPFTGTVPLLLLLLNGNLAFLHFSMWKTWSKCPGSQNYLNIAKNILELSEKNFLARTNFLWWPTLLNSTTSSLNKIQILVSHLRSYLFKSPSPSFHFHVHIYLIVNFIKRLVLWKSSWKLHDTLSRFWCIALWGYPL